MNHNHGKVTDLTAFIQRRFAEGEQQAREHLAAVQAEQEQEAQDTDWEQLLASVREELETWDG